MREKLINDTLQFCSKDAMNIEGLDRDAIEDDPTIHELLNEACQLKNRLQSEANKAYKEVDK